MIALMIKMIFWLVLAMILGFFVAWLLLKSIHEKKESANKKQFSKLIAEEKNKAEKLEKNSHKKEILFQRVTEELSETKELLSEKTSLLTTLEDKVQNNTKLENNSSELKKQNILLMKKIQELKEIDKKRLKELKGFEEIVLLVEDKLEENEKKYQRKIKAYLKNIIELKESLKLYEAYSSEPEFIISKDQFVQIEKQLLAYQKEIESLKHLNKNRQLKSEIKNF